LSETKKSAGYYWFEKLMRRFPQLSVKKAETVAMASVNMQQPQSSCISQQTAQVEDSVTAVTNSDVVNITVGHCSHNSKASI